MSITTVMGLVLCALQGSAGQQTFDSIDLGTLGGPSSMALAINARGQVVGSSATAAGEMHAFLWDRGVMLDLGTLGGGYSVANDVNDRGQVVGVSGDRAFLWQHGVMTALDAGVANAINELGQVVGAHSGASGRTAVLWERGRRIDLGAGPGSEAVDINDRAQVVGNVVGADAFAFLWQDGSIRHEIRGPTPTTASAINERGQVVGRFEFSGSDGSPTAFLWQDGVRVDLGWGAPLDVDDRGQLAGWMLGRLEPYPVLWRRGAPIALGQYGSAEAIDDRGQIAGWAYDGFGEVRATLWTRPSTRP